ncbi:hypothetical protein D3C72_386490 [compost metagenome]
MTEVLSNAAGFDLERVRATARRALDPMQPANDQTKAPKDCRRGRKVGGLAQILQRGSAPWGHWQQDADHADESG